MCDEERKIKFDCWYSFIVIFGKANFYKNSILA